LKRLFNPKLSLFEKCGDLLLPDGILTRLLFEEGMDSRSGAFTCLITKHLLLRQKHLFVYTTALYAKNAAYFPEHYASVLLKEYVKRVSSWGVF